MPAMPWGSIRSIALAVLLGLGALAPAQALAAQRATPTTPSVPLTTPSGPTGPGGSTKPKPKPKPAVRAHGRIYLLDSFFVSRDPVTVPKRVVHASGVVWPYVKGQWVTVRIHLGRRLIKSGNWRLKPSRNGRYGHFSVPFSSPGVGGVTIDVSHKGNREVRSFSVRRSLAALDENISFGSTG